MDLIMKHGIVLHRVGAPARTHYYKNKQTYYQYGEIRYMDGKIATERLIHRTLRQC